MSKIIGIGNNYALAFGFSWKPIDQLTSTGAQRKQLMDQGMRWEALCKLNQEDYIGASAQNITPYKGVTTLAGAAQVALHPSLAGRTVFVILEEPNEGDANSEIAVIGLINGNIVIDDYVTAEKARPLRINYSDRCKRAEQEFVVVGKSYTQGPVVEQYNWSDFAPTGGGKLFDLFGKRNGLPAVRVRPLEPKIPPKLVWGALSVIAVCLCLWGYVAYQNNEADKTAAAAARARANSGPILYTKAAAQLLTQPVWPANVTFRSLREQLNDFPTKREGWKLKTITCTPSVGCTATWDNDKDLANYRQFVATAPATWGHIALNNSGKELSHHMPVNVAMKPLPGQDKWPEARAFLMKQFSQWQKYWVVGFHPTLSESAQVAGIPDGVSVELAASLPDAVWATKWVIEKTYWYLSEGFDISPEHEDANLPDSVVVEKIAINFDSGQVYFDAEGKVYVRK